MSGITFFLLIWLYLLSAPVLHAEDSSRSDSTNRGGTAIPYSEAQWGKYLNPPLGQTLLPRAQVPAWESYPSGMLYDRGRQYGYIQLGHEYKVVDRKALRAWSGDNYFIKIEPSEANVVDPSCGKGCWVYQGKGGVKLPENFLPPGHYIQGPGSKKEKES